MKSDPVGRTKKSLISFLVIVCVWIQFALNADFRLGVTLGNWVAEVSDHKLVRPAAFLREISRYSHIFGQGTGLETSWRMFTPMWKARWRKKYQGIYADGTEELLPLPNQSPRNFWQTYFFDFREVKFQALMPRFQESYRVYVDYLCRSNPANKNGAALMGVRHFYEAQKFNSPAVAKETGAFISPEMNIKFEETLACPGA